MVGFINTFGPSISTTGGRDATYHNNCHKQYSLPIGRYTIGTSTGSIWDCKITCMGVNNALGTTSRRAGIGWISRRYGGNHSRYKVWDGPSFFFGDTSAFTNGQVGVCVESSVQGSMIVQFHNPGSNPPSACSFTLDVYMMSNNQTFDVSLTTAAPTTNYTSNPY